MEKRSYFYIVMILFGFLWMFGVGAAASWYFVTYVGKTPTPPTPDPIKQEAQEEYDILLITEEAPHKVLVVDMFEGGDFPNRNAHLIDENGTESTAFSPSLVSVESLGQENQYVSAATGTLDFNGKFVSFRVFEIYTPMVIRANKDYVKFGGATPTASADLSIDGKDYKAYAALLKGYNSDPFLVDFEGLGIGTDWLMYWDKDWNFYHLDKTFVDRPTGNYASHTFFSKITFDDSPTGSVDYSLDVEVVRDGKETTVNYDKGTIKLSDVGAVYVRPGYRDTSFGTLVGTEDGGIGVYQNIDAR